MPAFAKAYDAPVFQDIETNVSILRDGFKNHKEAIILYIRTDVNLTQDGAIWDEITSKAFELPDTGYALGSSGLRNNYVSSVIRLWSYGKGRWRLTYSDVEYRTTLEQDRVFEKRLDAVMESLCLDGRSDYEKVVAIYDYIRATVTYDSSANARRLRGDLSDGHLPYTAYAALVDGKAVCSGYAWLFQEMCQSAGVPAYYVTGYATVAGKEYGHAWDFVMLDGVWYQTDVTWDTVNQGSGREWFLKSANGFPHHHTLYWYQDAILSCGGTLADRDYYDNLEQQAS